MLTVVPCINGREKLLLLLHQIREAVHQPASVCRGEKLPGVMLQRGLCGIDGLVDIICICSLYCRDDFFCAVASC